ncbi:hypothetical protein ACHWQZ_G006789 [Mnemiopsis leidyi]
MLTKFFDILHKNGHLRQNYVLPRSRLESIVKRDGAKRIEELSERRPQGHGIALGLQNYLEERNINTGDRLLA